MKNQANKAPIWTVTLRMTTIFKIAKDAPRSRIFFKVMQAQTHNLKINLKLKI